MSNDEQYVEVLLDAKSAIDGELLIPPSKRKLGKVPEITFGGLKIRVARTVQAVNLLEMYESSGRNVPEELETFISYDIWLLRYSMSIIEAPLMSSLVQVGFDAWFEGEEKPIVVDLCPQSQFVTTTVGKAEVIATLGVEGDFRTGGDSLAAIASTVGLPSGEMKLCGDVSSKVVSALKWEYVTNKITVIGWGDFGGAWVFRKYDKPLTGDFRLAQTVCVPRDTEVIEVTAEVHAIVHVFGIVPVRLKSKPIPLVVVGMG